MHAREARMSKKGKEKEMRGRGESMGERVAFYRAVYLALLHPGAVLKPSVSRRETRAGVRTLIGKPRVVSSTRLGKKRATTL